MMGPTIYLLRPLTGAAKKWIEDQVVFDTYQQTPHGGVAVEHGYIDSIVAGLVEAGFEQGKDFEVLPG